MTKTLATVTIGQTPRPDVVDELRPFVPEATWIEAGALDGLDDAGIVALAPAPGDIPLVARLRDGRTVVVGERALTPRLQAAVAAVDDRADLVIVQCAGDFELTCRRPLIVPYRLVTATVAGIQVPGPLAVLVPHEGQIEPAVRRWRAQGLEAHARLVAPYAGEDLSPAGHWARDLGASCVLMDCLGYTVAMKTEVARASGLPTILVRSLVARVAGELAVSC
ncbi:MAG: AroM family protein [Deltaproteobacteria bacterium]|nr:AroM family protein [Deltaproteobacteria bacterium]